MDLEKLVDAYVDAYNQKDLEGLLGLFHQNAALYDAFWMETCFGEDLAEYFQSGFDEEPHWIQRIGELIPIDDGVVYRYGAYEFTDSGPGELVFNGAEVIAVRNEKIAGVSDFYCDPNQAALAEVGRWAARNPGRLRVLGSGLPAFKATQFRDKLSALMNDDMAFLNPNLTATEVADLIGCTVDHLNQVVSAELGANFYSYLDRQRAYYAKHLLLTKSEDPDYVYDVSSRAGFRTFENFVRTFVRFFDKRPEDFYREKAN